MFSLVILNVIWSNLQIRELNWSLDTEKASRTDLEMYVGVLNSQKTALIDDADQLRSRLNEGWFFFVSSMQAVGCKNSPDVFTG